MKKAKLSELISPLFKKYFISGEINLKVENSAKIIKKVEKKYKDGKKNKIDGLSVEYENWRFNIRESNTEPLFRVNLEAKSKKIVEQKKEEIIKIIKG